MRRHLIAILSVLIMFSCSRNVIQISYPEKFEGLTQLVLASQTTTVAFTEDVSKSLLAIFKSHAQVRVQSSVTYDFYLDFQSDGYDAKLDKKNKKLIFSAPPIRVKKPVINHSTVSFPETGLFVNENQEAIKILETLTDRFIDEGLKLLKQERVKNKCEAQLRDYLTGLCQEFEYDVDTLEIHFQTEKNLDQDEEEGNNEEISESI